MKNLRARRFSKIPIRGDFKASMSFAGTLWTYGMANVAAEVSLIIKSEATRTIIKVQENSFYLSLVKHKASINSLEVQIFCNISVNEDPYKFTICHNKLATQTSSQQEKHWKHYEAQNGHQKHREE